MIRCINRIDKLETLCNWTDIYVSFFFLITHVLENFCAMRISEDLQLVLRNNFMWTFSARTLCPPSLPLWSKYPPTPALLSLLPILGPQTSTAHLFQHFTRGKEHHWILRTLKSLDFFRHLNVCPRTQLLPSRLENFSFYS